MVALKIKGLPFKVSVKQIREFFQNFDFFKNSVVFGIGTEGRRNGLGAILFKNSKDAKLALIH